MEKTLTNHEWREAFKDWAMSQPDERPYSFFDTEKCPTGLYMQEVMGIKYQSDEWDAIWNDTNGGIAAATHNVSPPNPLLYDRVEEEYIDNERQPRTFKYLKRAMAEHPMFQ